MENRVYYLVLKDMEKIVIELKKNSLIYLAEIDGINIQSKNDYLHLMSDMFKFPIVSNGFDGYFDWMTDLSWLEKESYILIIYNYKEFMKNNLELKRKIVEDFNKIILPFWEKEVEAIMVGGYPKSFSVYLVE